MELKCSNIGYTYKGKKILNNLSFCIDSSKINGLMGHNKTLLLEIMDLEKKYQGDIYIDGTLVRGDNRKEFQRKISLVSQEHSFYTSSVEEEMKFIMDYYHYQPKDLKKRMLDSLKMVGLSSNYLTRKIKTLSNSEKILIKIACSFITNPDIILLDEVFVGLDYNSMMSILKIVKKLQEVKGKIIVIASNDVDFIYQYTNNVLILENGRILIQEDTSKVFQNINFLESHNLDIPDLVRFTKLAKDKKVRLSYHKDILDLIKDVYKHV